MEPSYILAIDQGTSGTKATLFDSRGELAGRHNEAHRQYYPKPGWVEHDAEEIYDRTLAAIAGVLGDTGVDAGRVTAMAVSNQRETAVIWDRETGHPVCHAIVWQCGRALPICRAMEKQGLAPMVREKTGLVLSPYFSAAKIKWVLDNVPGAWEKAAAGRLACGTMDSWLVYRLTGGRVHATDVSNASRTQLFDIAALRWDDDLLRAFTIPRSMMPEVLSSDGDFGTTSAGGIFNPPIPIAGVMGDSHAALFGQCCFGRGMAKATYGTGSSIMMNIGDRPLRSRRGLVTSLAWSMAGRAEYVFEGNINFAGATVKWLVDDMKLLPDSRSAGRLAARTEDCGGVYIVPAFTGLGAPYWDSDARGLICGITRGTGRAQIARAAEESIAYQVRDVLEIMMQESGAPVEQLRVDGGPTRDDFLMQFQADILPARVVRGRIEEISAAGAAYMAGLHMGLWSGRSELCALRTEERIFETKMTAARRDTLYAGWKLAVRRACFKE